MSAQISQKHELNVLDKDVWGFNPLSEKQLRSHQPCIPYITSGADRQPLCVENFFHSNPTADVANFDTAMYDDLEVA